MTRSKRFWTKFPKYVYILFIRKLLLTINRNRHNGKYETGICYIAYWLKQFKKILSLPSMICKASATKQNPSFIKCTQIDSVEGKHVLLISQAVYNGGGMKNNRAGSSLASQEPIRLPVLSTKEFFYSKGWEIANSLCSIISQICFLKSLEQDHHHQLTRTGG